MDARRECGANLIKNRHTAKIIKRLIILKVAYLAKNLYFCGRLFHLRYYT